MWQDKARFRLTPDDHYKVAKSRARRPTFRPVSGGKLKCNQLPHLGAITARQAQSIRNFCAPHGTKATESRRLEARTQVSTPRRQSVIRIVSMDHRGCAKCPQCDFRSSKIGAGSRTCGLCGTEFYVVAA